MTFSIVAYDRESESCGVAVASKCLAVGHAVPWGGADGLLAVMRDDPDLARVPVILTSAEASPKPHSGQVWPPVVQALGKPFSLTALLEIVRSGLGKGEPVSRKERREPAFPDIG